MYACSLATPRAADLHSPRHSHGWTRIWWRATPFRTADDDQCPHAPRDATHSLRPGPSGAGRSHGTAHLGDRAPVGRRHLRTDAQRNVPAEWAQPPVVAPLLVRPSLIDSLPVGA